MLCPYCHSQNIDNAEIFILWLMKEETQRAILERNKNHISDICKEERHVNNLNDEDYDGKDKHVLAIQIKEMDDLIENEENNDMVEVADNTNEQTARLQYLFQKLIKEVMVETNKDMEKRIDNTDNQQNYDNRQSFF